MSLAAHAAAIVFLADRVSRDGIEAATDAVSVEIVLGELDLPPTPPVAGADSEEPVEDADDKEAGFAQPVPAEEPSPIENELPEEVETPDETAALADPTGEAREPADEVEAAAQETEAPSEVQPDEAPEAPPSPAGDATTTPAEAEREAPAEAEPEAPSGSALPLTAETKSGTAEAGPSEPSATLETADDGGNPVEDPAYEVALPNATSIPLPTARPTPPAARTAQAPAPRSLNSQPQRPAARQPSRSPAPARQAAPRQQQAVAAPAAPRGATGGATRGDPAAYSRQLLAHVERHKTYPSQAQRQRIAGATRLSITIDRQGRLQGARVTQGSGHALLDDAALGVARRAAPYPRPPEGVGGGSISFAVTLRFSR